MGSEFTLHECCQLSSIPVGCGHYCKDSRNERRRMLIYPLCLDMHALVYKDEINCLFVFIWASGSRKVVLTRQWAALVQTTTSSCGEQNTLYSSVARFRKSHSNTKKKLQRAYNLLEINLNTV